MTDKSKFKHVVCDDLGLNLLPVVPFEESETIKFDEKEIMNSDRKNQVLLNGIQGKSHKT